MMSKKTPRRQLQLTSAERLSLEQARDHHPKPYVRERAAGLLRIAQGASPHCVALRSGLKPRDPDAVYGWLNAYETKGLVGLYHRPRRRRAFPPSATARLA
jgi:winged helix-turn helix protein